MRVSPLLLKIRLQDARQFTSEQVFDQLRGWPGKSVRVRIPPFAPTLDSASYVEISGTIEAPERAPLLCLCEWCAKRAENVLGSNAALVETARSRRPHGEELSALLACDVGLLVFGVLDANFPHVLAEGAVEPDDRSRALVWPAEDARRFAHGAARRQTPRTGSIAHVGKCRGR